MVAPFVARVSLSVTTTTTTTRAFVYSDVRCPNCTRVVMAVPGLGSNVEARTVRDSASRSGRGPVVSCKRCKSLVEVVTHK